MSKRLRHQHRVEGVNERIREAQRPKTVVTVHHRPEETRPRVRGCPPSGVRVPA